MKELCLRSKVNPPNNALRHSYASYWLARSSKEGLGELSKRMGNSDAICKRYYLETLLEKKVRLGLRFGARLALPSPVDISLGACCQSRLVSLSEYLFASLIEIRPAHVRSFARQITHQELCRLLDGNSGNRNKKRRHFKVLSSS